MKKEREEIRKQTVVSYYCDECGKPASNEWGHPYVCSICKRHFCDKHIHHEYEWGGDHADLYCYHCWNIGKKYRDEVEQIRNETDEKIDKKNNEWYQEAIKDLKVNKKLKEHT